jgi:serine-type D-Ala-D-Ala carboxypeptidase (penicillin-binding protein 5/6)
MSGAGSRSLEAVRRSIVTSFALLLISLCLLPDVAWAQPATQVPASFILVDNNTGKVLAGQNQHQNLPPASITKLLTALVAINQLPENKPVPITADAAAMPAMKIGVQPGQMWSRDDLLRSLLMVSANDAAVALADASGGGLTEFSTMRYSAARQLGLSDNPTLNDPAGLDDSTYSNDGGDRISARDMAIVARAALANPLISSIAATKSYRFIGPDGVHHELPNHNKLLNIYPGAIGLKTGYTQRAKNTFVGAATRNGRTMLVVVMGADNPYDYAEQLLDQGFATPVTSESATADVLPLHSLTNLTDSVATPSAAKAVETPMVRRHVIAIASTVMLMLVLGLAVFFVRIRDAATRMAVVENEQII